MKIARVRLSGFKSFVDPAELRILPGLTGIVGPNGCGKSNLLEAIRWAMGEGSAKSLRGAGMEDVIFAGTAKRPQRQFAEVTIAAEIEGDEVEIVRRIERGVGSAYRINGRDVRARDAQLLFADSATGAHSPALVSQGRIGAVIAAKPTERRAMLEEAAGISGLHVRRREAEIRLNATEANLARLVEVTADTDARIVVLRRQARSAARYRKLTDDIQRAEARLIYVRWRDADAAAATASKDAEKAEQAVGFAAEAQRAAAAWVRDASAKLEIMRATTAHTREALTDIRHQLDNVQRDREKIERRLDELATARAQLEADRLREGELLHDAHRALADLDAESTTLRGEIETAAVSQPASFARSAALEGSAQIVELALARAVASQAHDAAERRVAEAELATAEAAVKTARDDREHLRREADALTGSDELERARLEARAAREAAESAARGATETLRAAEGSRSDAADALAQAQNELLGATADRGALQSEANALARSGLDEKGAVERIRAAPGYESALAAALGNDLSAEIGASSATSAMTGRWAGADGSDDPVPTMGTPLAAHVDAPIELARRLAQVIVVGVDAGWPLALGQRLVTRDGRMRRWDGFITENGGTFAAERLRRRNRLDELTELLAFATAVQAETEKRVAAKRASADAIEAAMEAARLEREGAESCLRAALRGEDVARTAAERAAGQHADIAVRSARVEPRLATALDVATRARAALAALPPYATHSLAEVERHAAAAREALARARNEVSIGEARAADQRERIVAVDGEARQWRDRAAKAARRIEEVAQRALDIEREATTLEADPRRSSQALVKIESELAALTITAENAARAENLGEAMHREREEAAAAAAESFAAAREARAGATARAESEALRRAELGRIAGERFECSPPMLPAKLDFAVSSVASVAQESAALECAVDGRERLGPVNLIAASDLAEVEACLETAAAEVAEVAEATHRLRASVVSLNREGRERLRAAFDAVDGHFRTLFKTLFSGGEARLAMIDADDPLDAGLEILAQPPGKRLTSLTLLSGGEQALTAIALIFALFLTNPAPLCVLDEVDAPLDDANIDRFCDLLDAMVADTTTRYLIVTHNAVTMSRMHRLYGVTMVEQGISRLVSVDLGSAEALLAAE